MQKIARVLKYIPLLFMVPLYWMAFLVPKRRGLWVFGSWFGNKFADNSKYLFLYVKRNRPEIRPIWLTRKRGLVRELRAQGFECHHAYGIRGFLYSLIASKVVVSCARWDVNRFVIGGAATVQLWHGTPLKKIGYDDMVTLRQGERSGALSRLREKLFPFNNFECSDMYAVPSEEVGRNFSSAFRVPLSRMMITGYPRNDRLFKYDWACLPEDSLYLKRLRERVSFKRIFLYLPTHRGEGKRGLDLFERYGFDPATMQMTLEALDAVLICKAHFYNGPDRKGLAGCGRIVFPSNDEVPDIYPLLSETDILLTDYSSVYFDFLLLDRPVIFTPFDLAEYLNEDRELYYDYESVTPGPKARNWMEVEALLREAAQGDTYKDGRASVSGKFNGGTDRPFSRRVLEAISN